MTSTWGYSTCSQVSKYTCHSLPARYAFVPRYTTAAGTATSVDTPSAFQSRENCIFLHDFKVYFTFLVMFLVVVGLN